jgi:uncharacterized protein
MPAQGGGAPRIALVDALRGFALAGILLVNVQSFTWGAGNPLGYFLAPPTALEQAVYLLLAVFVAGKFYAIFAFLFGVGFSLQMRKLRRVAAAWRARLAPAHGPGEDGLVGGPGRVDPGDAQRIYRRRLAFLLVAGVLHGTLLYFGDVLTAYALCGFVLLHYADLRPRALLRATLGWWVAAYAIGLVWLMALATVPADAPQEIPLALREARGVYLEAGYAGQLLTRLNDYANQNLWSAPNFWPQVVAIFLLGALAGRLGWLRRPERHPRVWRNALWIGLLVGLPCAVVAGVKQTVSIRDVPGDYAVAEIFLGGVGSWLAAAYVALAVRARDLAALRRAYGWLAAAGRMPLTNYVAQSVIMGALLSGWGLGWGATLDHGRASALALLVYAVQIAVAQAVMRRYPQGPLEALWRRWTYRGARAEPVR